MCELTVFSWAMKDVEQDIILILCPWWFSFLYEGCHVDPGARFKWTSCRGGSCSPSWTPCGYVDVKNPQKGYYYNDIIIILILALRWCFERNVRQNGILFLVLLLWTPKPSLPGGAEIPGWKSFRRINPERGREGACRYRTVPGTGATFFVLASTESGWPESKYFLIVFHLYT
jgi:hypothetical protein